MAPEPSSPTRVPEPSLCVEKNQMPVCKQERGRQSLASTEIKTSLRTPVNTGQLDLKPTSSKTDASASSFSKEKQKHASFNKMRPAQGILPPSSGRKKKLGKELKDSSLVKLAPVEDPTRRRTEPRAILSDYGLQESREIPKHLYLNFLSEIVMIERQLREEKILMEIRKSREKREIKKQNDALREAIQSSARTVLQGFSYFPDMPNHAIHPASYRIPNEAQVDKRRARVHQTKTVKKMSLFYQRYKGSETFKR